MCVLTHAFITSGKVRQTLCSAGFVGKGTVIHMDIQYSISHIEHTAYIRHLAPPGVLSLVGKPGIMTIAAVKTTEVRLRRAVGMLMFWESAAGDRRLLYLFVDGLSRGRGIGRQLLSYFRPEASFPFIVTRDDMMDSQLMMQALKNKGKHEEIKPIKAFPRRQVTDALVVLAHGSKVCLPELESADGQLSLLSMQGNDPRGMAIVRRYGEVVMLRAVLAEEEPEAVRLMEVLTLRLARRMDACLFFTAEGMLVPDGDGLLEKLYGLHPDG